MDAQAYCSAEGCDFATENDQQGSWTFVCPECGQVNVERSVLQDYDVNVWFREFTDPVANDSLWDDCLTVAVYEYRFTDGGTTSTETPFSLRLTLAETRYLLSEYPEGEYGGDWWESAYNFYQVAPPRVRAFLDGLPVVLMGGELIG
jgi:hypothetical protein